MDKTSLRGDVSTALSCTSNESAVVHVPLVQLKMKVIHDPTETTDNLWEGVEVSGANEVREKRVS